MNIKILLYLCNKAGSSLLFCCWPNRFLKRNLPFKQLSLVFTLLLSSPVLENTHAQTLKQILSGKSLSLTIWGAQLPEKKADQSPWDINSLPDSLIRIYLGDRLLKQSLVVRNELKPMWSLTIGPIPKQRFYDGPLVVEIIEQDLWGEDTIESIMIPLPTQEDLAQVLTLEGKWVKPLIYQWVNTTAKRVKASSSSKLPNSPLKESFTSDQATSDTETSVLIEQEKQDKRRRERTLNSAKRQSKAASLYRAYLKAQFSGDQLQAHRILLRLALNYSQTRHGRKARRIMLLDGR